MPYSDLSDYFYVWLRRAIGEVHPEALATEVTPKRSEMVQNPAHNKSAEFFESAMSRAFGEMHRTLKDSGIMVLVFAHKSTAAWETLLKALLDNNLVVTASWPIETEKPGRTRAIGSAALASSVFIVCRKRSAHEEGFVDDVEPALKSRLHERLDYFWSQGIRGADFFMSAIGPAVEVFGRHKRVLKLSGDEVTIAELLDKVRGIVADYALQRIVHGEAAGNVDEASRFYVIWRWAFGTTEVESGEAIHMAQSMGVEFNELVAEKGVLHKKGDKVSLKGPLDRKKVKGLGEPAATGTLAPLIDVLHRAANLWAAGERQDSPTSSPPHFRPAVPTECSASRRALSMCCLRVTRSADSTRTSWSAHARCRRPRRMMKLRSSSRSCSRRRHHGHHNPWRQVVTPHDNIKQGRVKQNDFAASLADVLHESGNPDYYDPVRFFNRTFLTAGLRQLAGEVVGRLTGQGDGDAVMQIQTPFGGGKRTRLSPSTT